MLENFWVKKECTVLKSSYKLGLLGLFFTAFFYLMLNLHSFLSLNNEIRSDVLIVEGWLPDYALKEAISKFKKGRYSKIITTGGPLSVGSYLKEYKDYAHLAKASLVAMGMAPEKIIAIAAQDVQRDRTYHSALAVKNYLKNHNLIVSTANLASLGPHTRRSTILFQKAFKKETHIGSIAIKPEDYDIKKWYASSAGVRTTINESITYLYVLILK